MLRHPDHLGPERLVVVLISRKSSIWGFSTEVWGLQAVMARLPAPVISSGASKAS
jgi:hypothetical protein